MKHINPSVPAGAQSNGSMPTSLQLQQQRQQQGSMSPHLHGNGPGSHEGRDRSHGGGRGRGRNRGGAPFTRDGGGDRWQGVTGARGRGSNDGVPFNEGIHWGTKRGSSYGDLNRDPMPMNGGHMGGGHDMNGAGYGMSPNVQQSLLVPGPCSPDHAFVPLPFVQMGTRNPSLQHPFFAPGSSTNENTFNHQLNTALTPFPPAPLYMPSVAIPVAAPTWQLRVSSTGGNATVPVNAPLPMVDANGFRMPVPKLGRHCAVKNGQQQQRHPISVPSTSNNGKTPPQVLRTVESPTPWRNGISDYLQQDCTAVPPKTQSVAPPVATTDFAVPKNSSEGTQAVSAGTPTSVSGNLEVVDSNATYKPSIDASMSIFTKQARLDVFEHLRALPMANRACVADSLKAIYATTKSISKVIDEKYTELFAALTQLGKGETVFSENAESAHEYTIAAFSRALKSTDAGKKDELMKETLQHMKEAAQWSREARKMADRRSECRDEIEALHGQALQTLRTFCEMVYKETIKTLEPEPVAENEKEAVVVKDYKLTYASVGASTGQDVVSPDKEKDIVVECDGKKFRTGVGMVKVKEEVAEGRKNYVVSISEASTCSNKVTNPTKKSYPSKNSYKKKGSMTQPGLEYSNVDTSDASTTGGKEVFNAPKKLKHTRGAHKYAQTEQSIKKIDGRATPATDANDTDDKKVYPAKHLSTKKQHRKKSSHFKGAENKDGGAPSEQKAAIMPIERQDGGKISKKQDKGKGSEINATSIAVVETKDAAKGSDTMALSCMENEQMSTKTSAPEVPEKHEAMSSNAKPAITTPTLTKNVKKTSETGGPPMIGYDKKSSSPRVDDKKDGESGADAKATPTTPAVIQETECGGKMEGHEKKKSVQGGNKKDCSDVAEKKESGKA